MSINVPIFCKVVVPSAAATLDRIYDIIKQELSFEIYSAESRAFLVECVRELARGGADAVILGCTELELLVGSGDVPDCKLLPSAALHIEAAASVATGEARVEDFAPPGTS